jgi:superfamily II DNA/RNA helicase
LSDNTISDFETLGVNPRFIEQLAGRNITEPTEIQKQVIPVLAGGESLLFKSATGTGKTFAYLLPLLGRLLDGLDGSQGKSETPFRTGGGPRILVCAPTYELCSQIKQELDFLLSAQGLKESAAVRSSLLIGSVQLNRQIENLKVERPAVVVGNPGRLLLLSAKGKLKFSGLDCVVLDEGDRLASDELSEETGGLMKAVRSYAPKGRSLQTVICSATFSTKSREKLTALAGGDIKSLESGGLEVLRLKVEHWAIFSEERQKAGTLRSLLAAIDGGKKKSSFKALIFTSRGSLVETIAAQLQYRRLAAAGLWGGMDKKARKAALEGFRSGVIRFLVTTDLAARGMDINDVNYIITLDTGEDKDSYIHRAGRTARAGKHGTLITIGSEADLRRLSKLEKQLGIAVYPKELYEGRITAPLG